MVDVFGLENLSRWVGLNDKRDTQKDRLSKFQPISQPRPKKVALALGGGAALGWAHIGFLQVLKEHKLIPDMVVGTSIGAIAGAAFASDRLNELESFARSLTPRKMLTWMDFSLARGGLINGEKLAKELHNHFGNSKIEDLAIPFYCVATDLMTGEEVWFNKGDLVSAVRASYAIPGVFVPVKTGNRWLVDGGLTNPLPVSAARHFGADKVIAIMLDDHWKNRGSIVETGSIAPSFEATSNLLSDIHFPFFSKGSSNDNNEKPKLYRVIIRSISIGQEKLSELQLSRFPPDLLIAPRLAGIEPFEFYKARTLIHRGRQAALLNLPQLEEMLSPDAIDDISHDESLEDISS